MKTFASVLHAAAWLTLMLHLAGCDGEPQVAAPAPKEKGRLLAFSVQTLDNPFFVEMNKALRKVVESNGDRLVTVDAQYNSLRQKTDIGDLLKQQPAAIFLNPVNWEGIKGTLIEAKRQNVPVVVVDAPVAEPDLILSQVASDNMEAGRLVAQALAQANPNAQVAVLTVSVNKACIDRIEGFKEELTRHPGIKIVDIQEGKGTTEGANQAMRDMLARFQNINAVFPNNDPSAMGCIAAIESAGRAGQVIVVAVDGSREGIEAVKEGKLHATAAQFPEAIGRTAAEKVYDHFNGKPVEKVITVPVKLVTRESLEQ